jgi:biotin carboxylase
MNSRIIILGGNPETASLFQVAKKMGLFTIACNPYKDSPVKKISDLSFEIDPKDAAAIDRIIIEQNVNAVVLGVSDPLLPFYKSICERNELRCYANSQSVQAFSSKSNFNEICKRHDLSPIPQFGIVSSPEFEIDQLNYPVVVKPIDGGAAVGVTECNSLEELRLGVKRALEISIKKQVIIEKSMKCDDLFAYYTFIEGQVFLTAVADRIKSNKNDGLRRVCLYANYPSKHLDPFLDKVNPKLIAMFNQLDISFGLLCIQFFFDGENFFPYDPGFRIQGEAPHVYVNELYGLDQREMLIKYALGADLSSKEFEEKNDPGFMGKVARTIWVLGKLGIISKYEGLEEIQAAPGVISVQTRFRHGDELTREMIGTERQVLLRIHLMASSIKALDDLNCYVVSKLKILDSSGNSLLQDIYDPTLLETRTYE